MKRPHLIKYTHHSSICPFLSFSPTSSLLSHPSLFPGSWELASCLPTFILDPHTPPYPAARLIFLKHESDITPRLYCLWQLPILHGIASKLFPLASECLLSKPLHAADTLGSMLLRCPERSCPSGLCPCLQCAPGQECFSLPGRVLSFSSQPELSPSEASLNTHQKEPSIFFLLLHFNSLHSHFWHLSLCWLVCYLSLH